METIGQRIAKLRDIKKEEYGHCTQQDLADAMGVGKNDISKWERGLVSMNAEKIDQLSRYFNVSCDYLIRGGVPEHLMLMDETGLSHETIAVLKYWKNKTRFIAEMIDVLAKDPAFLIILHEYLFGDYEEEPTEVDPRSFRISMERYNRLCVLDRIEKLREGIQNGKS